MVTQLIERKITNGPSKFDMLLSQYDHPRRVKFEVSFGQRGRSWDEFEIESATRGWNDIWYLVGNVIGSTVGFGTKPIPMVMVYIPQTREGTLTVNPTGKGVAVMRMRPQGRAIICFDMGGYGTTNRLDANGYQEGDPSYGKTQIQEV